MLYGLPPYHQPEPNPVLLYERIAQGPAYIRWPAFSLEAKDLVMKLMEINPSRRYGNLQHGAGDVFAHPWFREVDWEKLRRREIMAPYIPKIDGDGDASAYVSTHDHCPTVVQAKPTCFAYFLSSRFERYPEGDEVANYGKQADDTWGHCFPEFEYMQR